jgi:hypothetical protein
VGGGGEKAITRTASAVKNTIKSIVKTDRQTRRQTEIWTDRNIWIFGFIKNKKN